MIIFRNDQDQPVRAIYGLGKLWVLDRFARIFKRKIQFANVNKLSDYPSRLWTRQKQTSLRFRWRVLFALCPELQEGKAAAGSLSFSSLPQFLTQLKP